MDTPQILKKDERFQLLYASAGDLLSALKALQQTLEPFFKEKKNCRVTSLGAMPELKQTALAQPVYSVSVFCAVSWDSDDPENEIRFLKDQYKQKGGNA